MLLAVCAAGPDKSCALQQVADLPLQPLGTLSLVTADINGHPASLILDTGSDSTVLSSTAAERLGVAWDERAPVEGVGAGGTFRAFPATIPNLALGNALMSDVRVSVVEQGLPLVADGVLGIDVLAGYELDLDMPHRRLVLYRARTCPAALPPWTAPSTRLVVQRQQFGHLFTPGELNGRPVLALLDTGASHTTVGLAAAHEAGMTAAALRADPAIRASSAGKGRVAVRKQRFQTLKIGDDVLEQPVLWVADLPPFAGDLVIGGDYLATRRVWFSFATSQVFITINKQP